MDGGSSNLQSDALTSASSTASSVCIPQTAAVVLQCSKPLGSSSLTLIATLFDMGWPFATLMLTALIMAFGPRGKMGRLLDALANLIDRVKSIKVGNNVITTEEEQALIKKPAIGVNPVGALTGSDKSGTNDDGLILKLFKKDFDQVSIGDYPYLMHEAKRTTQGDFYVARVYLEFWTKNKEYFQKDKVEKVFYRVDDTFSENWRVLTSADADRSFQLILRIYGEFTIIAVVKTTAGEYIWLTRYLDLPGRPTH